MTNEELKAAVAEKLALSGIWLNTHAAMRIICLKVAKHTGRERRASETMWAYLTAYVGAPKPPARDVRPFRPLAATPHPRAAEIDMAQPPFMTPRGAVGNGSENSQVWRR